MPYSPLEGFLPPRALLMGRREMPSVDSPAYSLVFLGAPAEFEGLARELLEKMITALGLRRDLVAVAAYSDPVLPRGAVQVILGRCFDAPRGHWTEFRGQRSMCTHAPSDMLQNPSLKKEAWDDLKKVAQDLGIVLPSRS